MRTLAIESKILKELEGLPPQHKKKILDIVQLLKTGLETSGKKHSITELRGCGKKLWNGINAQKYVDKLREEWD